WNNVFIQYNRKADGTLEPLPAMHVDTGMGFERLVRAIQNKTSNYDTDVFTGTIFEVEKITGKKYNFSDTKMDVAFRVLADHIRAISFTIADGQLPANNGAGYVIRRILRRAVRYYYTYLDYKQPLLYQLIDGLSKQFENVFPELYLQKSFVEKVIREEEKSFLKTLEGGLRRIEDIKVQNNTIDGQDVFELYDTYGFPVDLTRLIADEKGWKVDEDGFSKALNEQKERSRADAKRETGDWVMAGSEALTTFVGYDDLIVQGSKAVKYRVLKQKDKELYQLVLDVTPFYPEGGGQVGDTGFMMFNGEVIKVLDTKKENDLIIHIIDRIPDNISGDVYAEVDANKRSLTENNHSATHLLHAALRQVLGTHVQQKGSLVKDDYLRFDVSHYQRITDSELAQVEKIVNEKIRQNIPLEEARALPIEEAKKSGAMMLFGEKYGDSVRMITFDPAYSRELCGGCHVKYTGQLGLFKITSESGIAAGVRRIEAVTANKAEEYVNQQIHELNAIKSFFKNNINTIKNVSDLLDENKELAKEVEKLRGMQASGMKASLISGAKEISGARVVVAKLKEMDTKSAKTLSVNILSEIDNGLVLFGIEDQGKATIMLSIAENLTKSKGWHAGNIIKELSKEINGGGGGQAFFATAGGTDVAGLDKALARLDEFLK
ncbi:MAG TPA: alanine--tRNA ligase, partial [Saprospiraceae bacterium]|nr:alanine--tRNA ligase [Saprospiraceae bacterium]